MLYFALVASYMVIHAHPLLEGRLVSGLGDPIDGKSYKAYISQRDMPKLSQSPVTMRFKHPTLQLETSVDLAQV